MSEICLCSVLVRETRREIIKKLMYYTSICILGRTTGEKGSYATLRITVELM